MYRSAGDPGFLGNLFRGVVRTVGGAVLGTITSGGNPIGGIRGAIAGAGSAIRSNVGHSVLEAGDDPKGDAARLARVHAHHAAALAHHAVAPIGSSAAGTPVSMSMSMVGAGGGGGGGGRRRRMRWTNVKALGRAERRISSAVKHMTKYVRWVHPNRPGHLVPRFRKGKKR